MTDVAIDIENRVQLASLELLQAWAGLVAAVGAADRIVVGYLRENTAKYPCAYFKAINFVEPIPRTGWYNGSLRMGAASYREDDQDRAQVNSISGWFRGWAQQDDLAEQLTATVAAKAAATLLTCLYVTLDGTPFDNDDDQESTIYDWNLDVTFLVRPSR